MSRVPLGSGEGALVVGFLAKVEALVKVVEGKCDHIPLRDQKNEPKSEQRKRPCIPGVANQILKTHEHGDEREDARVGTRAHGRARGASSLGGIRWC
jgi:hypothetical protein